MRVLIVSVLAAGFFSASLQGCGTTREASPADDPGLDLGDPALVVGDPILAANLKIWPVIDTAKRGQVDYLSLDQAAELGAVEVLETGNVQQLELMNRSDRPILLLSGEVLQGGKQDRIIAKDMVIEPGKSAPLASFCIEQGRWSAPEGEGASFKSSGEIVAGPVKWAAQVRNDQSGVWTNVAYLNAANAAAPSTGTYSALLSDEDLQKQIGAHAASILAHLESYEGAVGFVAAIDPGVEGEQVVAEVFGIPALFSAFRGKLVRSYCLDAISRTKAPELEDTALLGFQVQTAGVSYDRIGTAGSVDIQELFLEDSDGAGSFGGVSNGRGVVVADDRIEAGGAELHHLHRTIYKRK